MKDLYRKKRRQNLLLFRALSGNAEYKSLMEQAIKRRKQRLKRSLK